MLTDVLMDAPTSQSDTQRQAITSLRDAYASWEYPDKTPARTAPIPLPSPSQIHQTIIVQNKMMKQPKLQHTITPPENSKCDLQWF